MKHTLLYILAFVSILANVSRAQPDRKTLLISLSYAEPLSEMKLRNGPSFGAFLMYGAPIDETFRVSFEGGAYAWARKTSNSSKESALYRLSVPILGGVDVLMSDNYLFPFLGVRAGIQFYWGDIIRDGRVVEKIENQAGFLVHPEIGWRFPFSNTYFLDVRGGYAHGTGKATPFSYATFNLGLAFAIPSSSR